MPSKNDEMGVSIKGAFDSVTQSGSLSVQTKSRFLAAVDRLFGSIFDLPAAWMDTKAKRIEHEAELRRDFRAQQAKILEQALADPDPLVLHSARAKAAIDSTSFDGYLNCSAVVRDSIPLLESFGEKVQFNNDDDIDEDWIRRFRHYAQEARSEELRHLWGRVLAGEVQSPGTFGASALRFIFELDKILAERCESIAKLAVGDNIYLSDEEKSGQPLVNALALQASGLIAGVVGNLSSSLTFGANGKIHIVTTDLALELEGKQDEKMHFQIWIISDLGKQIFSLLERPDDENNLRRIAIIANNSEVRAISLLKLGIIKGNEREVLSSEVLYKSANII